MTPCLLGRHAIRLFHDVIVEMERDALLYPFLNEPSGDSGNSLLLFGGALHNAEFALLLAVSTQNGSIYAKDAIRNSLLKRWLRRTVAHRRHLDLAGRRSALFSRRRLRTPAC